MRIGPAANVARLNVNEIITALWSFANAQGLLTDDINERTGAAGVTIDGVRLRDTAIDILGKPSPSNRVLGCDVIGDADERFRLHAGGIMQWGDGTGARDTQLQRDAADELGTPDDFNVGGVLDLGGDVEYSERSETLVIGDNDDVETGAVTIQRLTPSSGGSTVTGFNNGRGGRRLLVQHVGLVGTITLQPDDAGSVASNRMFLPGFVALILNVGDGVDMWYDSTTSRWRAAAYA